MADIPLDALQSGSSDGFALSGAQAFRFDTGSPNGIGVVNVAATDCSAALTTLFTLTGRYVMTKLDIAGINTASGSLRIVIIVDGVTVVDATEASSTRNQIGQVVIAPFNTIKCNSSIQVRLTKPLSTAVTASYCALAVV